jgi:hypothetical protein
VNKATLLAISAVFLILGGGATYAAGRVQCFLGTCLFATQGSDLFSYQGEKLDPGTAQVITSAPIPLFGLGGCFLIAGLVKSGKSREKS